MWPNILRAGVCARTSCKRSRCCWPLRFASLSLHLQLDAVAACPPQLLLSMWVASKPKGRRALRGNTIRGNRTESLWEGNLPLRESLRGPLQTSEKSLKTSEKSLKTAVNLKKTSETLPLRDPLRGRFLSQRLSDLLPLLICPLNSLREGPSHTKNTTATQNIVNYYAVAFPKGPFVLEMLWRCKFVVLCYCHSILLSVLIRQEKQHFQTFRSSKLPIR